MHGSCRCAPGLKLNVTCGSPTCYAKQVYEDTDILKHITVTNSGRLHCKLPHYYWNASKHEFESDKNLEDFVKEIKAYINE